MRGSSSCVCPRINHRACFATPDPSRTRSGAARDEERPRGRSPGYPRRWRGSRLPLSIRFWALALHSRASKKTVSPEAQARSSICFTSIDQVRFTSAATLGALRPLRVCGFRQQDIRQDASTLGPAAPPHSYRAQSAPVRPSNRAQSRNPIGGKDKLDHGCHSLQATTLREHKQPEMAQVLLPHHALQESLAPRSGSWGTPSPMRQK
jgi:hypothetical protein